MTFKELTELLVSHVGRWDDDLRVVVPTENGGMCHHHMVDVRAVLAGGDWTKNLLMLSLAEPVILHRQFDKSLDVVARAELDRLQEAHAAMGGKYIHKSREAEWVDGFEQGVRAFTLAHGATLPDGDTVPVQRALLAAIVAVGKTEGLEGLRPLLGQLGEAAGILATGTGKMCHCGTWFVASPDGERECQDCSKD